MASLKLVVDGVTVVYDGFEAVSNASITVEPSSMVAIVGPNGSGKTSLLKAIAGILRARRGAVYLDSRSILELDSRSRARLVAYAPPAINAPRGCRVREFIETSRYPYQSPLSLKLSPGDEQLISKAMEAMEISSLGDRELSTLSSGELQRAIIAAILARQASVVLVDEPTAFLDLRYKILVLEALRRVAETGRIVIYATHELQLAARYSTMMVLMAGGRILAVGSPREVLKPELIEKAYRVRVRILYDDTSTPIIVPLEPI